MSDVFVLAEHRQGVLRDINFEILTKASDFAQQSGGSVVTVLLGSGVDDLADKLSGYSDKVLYVDDPLFASYNCEYYQQALRELIKQYNPYLVMIPHTTQGVEIAPPLAVEMNIPLITDLIDIGYESGSPKPVRQYYQGKVNADFTLKGDPPYLVTFREASVEPAELSKAGNIEKVDSPIKDEVDYRKFIEYIEAEVGDVDITQSEVLIAVGRGVREEKNMEMIEELAKALNADICGSRAATDAGLVPHDRQVGTSGKVVKPKLYLAVGISGAFQHLAGMKGSKSIIAINKDPDAPIFSVADYAIIDDLFKVVPALTEKVKELRG